MRLHCDAVCPESPAAKAGSRPGVTLRGVDVLNSCQYLDTNMGRRSTIKKDVIAQPGERRRYDSTVRRARVDETRARILAAGSQLAHRASRWDWSDLTARTIAAQAGVSERTVYRHFSTFAASGQRRCDAIARALSEVTHTSPEAERHMAAAGAQVELIQKLNQPGAACILNG